MLAVPPHVAAPSLRSSSRRWAITQRALLVSWPLAIGAALLARDDGVVNNQVVGPMLAVYSLVACAAAARAAFHPSFDARTRLAWRVLTGGLVLALVSCVLFAAEASFPSAGDYVRLSLAPVLLAGLLAFPMRTRTARDTYRLALDVGIVVAGGFVVLWHLALGPALAARGVPADVVAAAVAYPLADLVLIVAASAVVLRGAAFQRRPLLWFAAALCFLVLADVQHSSTALRTAGADTGNGFLKWACLVSAFFLMATAAVEQCRGAGQHALTLDPDRGVRRSTLLPYTAVTMGLGLLLVLAWRDGLHPWGGLISGATVMMAFVMARQIVTLRENHSLIVSDHLTGLASRPRLHTEAARALASSQRSGVPMAVLVIDMDAFKEVNDSLGHDAGDDVLVAFGALLDRTLSRTDTIARMGGDEFAVVLPAVGSLANATEIVERLIAEMRKPVIIGGRPMSVRASIGIAMSDAHSTVAELLRQADQAMYAAKRHQSRGWDAYLAELPADRS